MNVSNVIPVSFFPAPGLLLFVKLIDTSHAIDELPSYDSSKPAPDKF
jgi:hypothetical protein